MVNDFFCPLVFTCNKCQRTVDNQYLVLTELLNHHFLYHERKLVDRRIQNQSILGYTNTKTWTNIFGKTFAQTDAPAR